METDPFYSIAFHQNSFAMVISSLEDGRLVNVNDAFLRVTGYTRQEVIGRTVADINLWVDPQERKALVELLSRQDQVMELETRFYVKTGEIRYALMNARVITLETGRYLLSSVVDITRRRLAEIELEMVLRTTLEGFCRLDADRCLREVNNAFCQMVGYGRDELLQMQIGDLEAVDTPEQIAARMRNVREQGSLRFETRHRRKDGSLIDVDISASYLPGENGSYYVFLRDITDRRQSENQLRRKVSEMDSINRISTAMRTTESLSEMLPVLLDETLMAVQSTTGMIVLYNQASRRLGASVARGWLSYLSVGPEPARQALVEAALLQGRLVHLENLVGDARLHTVVDPPILSNWDCLVMPIRTVHEVVGLLVIGFEKMRRPSEAQTRLLGTLSEIAGNAIHRTRLHEQTRRSLKRMASLLEIFQTITSSLDLRMTLEVILTHTRAQLEVDAAAVLLMSPVTHYLEYRAWQGFKTRRLEPVQIRPGAGTAGRAVYSRAPVISVDLPSPNAGDSQARLLREEGFQWTCSISFQNKGQVAGVLEVYLRRPPPAPEEDWLDFFGNLAGQVALAVDKINLFESLQRSNIELSLAYDATIEGWSQAMDLRDQDTENHTRRVTEMTIRLAEVMGIGQTELVHIRRGALLHDLGKIAIPDRILRKPDSLNQEEWVIMRGHPQIAFDLLANNEFLRPALDIPFSHHEKWDGSGYPRGLRGEQIPLAARLFAIVDVYDALRSDRTYRKAWEEDRTLEYIRDQAAKHFDPRVVKVFLNNLDYLLGRG